MPISTRSHHFFDRTRRPCYWKEQVACHKNQRAVSYRLATAHAQLKVRVYAIEIAFLVSVFVTIIFYHQLQLEDANAQRSRYKWNMHRQDLLLIEQDIRHWSREELDLRQQVLELALINDQTKERKIPRWTCATWRDQAHDDRRKQEHHVRVVDLQERRKHLLFQIRRARQLQFRLLKHWFNGIRRHWCAGNLEAAG